MPLSNQWALRHILVEKRSIEDYRDEEREDPAEELRRSQEATRDAARREAGKLVDEALSTRDEARRHLKM